MNALESASWLLLVIAKRNCNTKYVVPAQAGTQTPQRR